MKNSTCKYCGKPIEVDTAPLDELGGMGIFIKQLAPTVCCNQCADFARSNPAAFRDWLASKNYKPKAT